MAVDGIMDMTVGIENQQNTPPAYWRSCAAGCSSWTRERVSSPWRGRRCNRRSPAPNGPRRTAAPGGSGKFPGAGVRSLVGQLQPEVLPQPSQT
jgi:hypothetical protein